MHTFTNEAEQTAYNLAEALSEKAMSYMRNAEEAAEAFRTGQTAMRRQFKARGLSEAEADIRYSGTAQASRAIADNSFFMSLASMYNTAAATQYAKALYHKKS
ncbi:hypothetical protein [Actinoplanes teichomyceticus]|uniref:Excreted virulence factor EspC (Type VII ESX diderm) n=1 Tax=Actinoplanes teichomyceticus TaxID=1867 RepID=A0A561WRW1_ACTTI|nr:hypothetical protein [Actinoplanes teichomyceticus]TWG26598.1 hypothetical protein FHX34_1011586 [Actinoplanes teichomyceticus]GIF16918.1 hypothetical protein Ate01nite_69500 [Actinoplanes teichomyceticus]